MYNSLEAAILAETEKASAAVVIAYDAMRAAMDAPMPVWHGQMRKIATTQAELAVWTMMWLSASKYMEEVRTGEALPESVEPRLGRKVQKMVDELLGDWDPRSTDPWAVAELAAKRDAKYTVYKVLRAVYNEL